MLSDLTAYDPKTFASKGQTGQDTHEGAVHAHAVLHVEHQVACAPLDDRVSGRAERSQEPGQVHGICFSPRPVRDACREFERAFKGIVGESPE